MRGTCSSASVLTVTQQWKCRNGIMPLWSIHTVKMLHDQAAAPAGRMQIKQCSNDRVAALLVGMKLYMQQLSQ